MKIQIRVQKTCIRLAWRNEIYNLWTFSSPSLLRLYLCRMLEMCDRMFEIHFLVDIDLSSGGKRKKWIPAILYLLSLEEMAFEVLFLVAQNSLVGIFIVIESFIDLCRRRK